MLCYMLCLWFLSADIDIIDIIDIIHIIDIMPYGEDVEPAEQSAEKRILFSS